MNLQYFLFRLWEIVVDHAIPLIALLLLAILVPRLGRLTIRIIEGRLDEEEESTKSRLALLGALVYVIQIVAFFLIILLALSNLGVPPLGAAVPATIVSAAVGFGAQSIIGDFLSGFFILSERQFGVGDYVSFDGTNSVTEGTVVALTLRATKVRTPSGEVVMIPNGSAGVITNFSQEWSRAVVNFDVPVRSGENLDEIQQTIADTAQTAVQDPSIADDVAGDVEILPATSLTAPTAAGPPWKVNFRVLVVVNPARQWAVERGIRSALLNVFWDHFRTPFESTDKELAQMEGPKEASLSDAPTEHLPTASPPRPRKLLRKVSLSIRVRPKQSLPSRTPRTPLPRRKKPSMPTRTSHLLPKTMAPADLRKPQKPMRKTWKTLPQTTRTPRIRRRSAAISGAPMPTASAGRRS